jgi:Fe-S-cluster containining protein
MRKSPSIPFSSPLDEKPNKIAQLHAFVDQVTASIKRQSKPITCAKGCAACCREPVHTFDGEVRWAWESLTEVEKLRVKGRLPAWIEAAQENKALLDQRLPNAFAYRLNMPPCPFLEGSLCMVYNRRPLSCREFLATGPKEFCDRDDLRPRQEFVKSPQFASLVGQEFVRLGFREMDTGLLPVLLGVMTGAIDRETVLPRPAPPPPASPT